MKFSIITTVSFLLLATPLPGAAAWSWSEITGWFGPDNYDDCILKSMQGVTSDKAALIIANSCREKFPLGQKSDAKSKANKDLLREELDRITGRASPGYNEFSGSIYNGNSHITVSEITVKLTMTVNGEKVTRTYRTEVSVNPLTTGDFSFDTLANSDSDTDFSWSIRGARGYDSY